MNWIERMYEIKAKDLYSQNGEGILLEYILTRIYGTGGFKNCHILDIGAGDGFILSNSRHLENIGLNAYRIDLYNRITVETCLEGWQPTYKPEVISIDIDGFDYWILDKMIPFFRPAVVIAEFNAMYTDSRTIEYNPDHVWAGDSYYGFTFDAGVKLAEKHEYKVIFQVADMNMIMVRSDLIEGLTIPPVTYNKSDYFKMSERTDWIMI